MGHKRPKVKSSTNSKKGDKISTNASSGNKKTSMTVLEFIQKPTRQISRTTVRHPTIKTVRKLI